MSEEMREGSDVFAVHAFLPAEASFGLMTEMRQRCSGGASASLLLSHWERLQACTTHPPPTLSPETPQHSFLASSGQ